MRIYITNPSAHAGRWIYKGYQEAFAYLGYDIVLINNLDDVVACENKENINDYMIMVTDAQVQPRHYNVLNNCHKAFVFAQPNAFPLPWGRHPNFFSLAPDKVIHELNQMDNVKLWTFGDNIQYHQKWKKVNTVPLAFDSISYMPMQDEEYKQYDICFIGGWANNGFHEKRQIMIDIFKEFKKSDLKCGFFVDKNMSHEQENRLLYNSKLSLNIHDAYQRILGYDTNERTFKSLGLNGALVSDTVTQLNNLFPDIKTSVEPKMLVQIAKDHLSLSDQELIDVKERHRQNILDNHCYVNRAEQLLAL